MESKAKLAESVRDLAKCDVGNDLWAQKLKNEVAGRAANEFGFFIVAQAVLTAAKDEHLSELEELYISANDYYSKGNYSRARTAFQSLGDFRDSRQKLDSIHERIREADYARAENAFNQGFRIAADRPRYVDSNYYRRTKAHYDYSGCYTKRNECLKRARDAFSALGNYRDSKQKVETIDCEYDRQRQEIAQKKKDEADKQKAKEEREAQSRRNSALFSEKASLTNRMRVAVEDALKRYGRDVWKAKKAKDDAKEGEREIAKIQKEIQSLARKRDKLGFFDFSKKSAIDSEITSLRNKISSIRTQGDRALNDSSNPPYTWHVLSYVPDKNQALIAPTPPLDPQPFNNTDTNVSWRVSSIRQWLNSGFKQSLPSDIRNALVPKEHKVYRDERMNFDWTKPSQRFERQKPEIESEVVDAIFLPYNGETIRPCINEIASHSTILDRPSFTGLIWLGGFTLEGEPKAIDVKGYDSYGRRQYATGKENWRITSVPATASNVYVIPIMWIDVSKIAVNWDNAKSGRNKSNAIGNLTKAGWDRGEATREIEKLFASVG